MRRGLEVGAVGAAWLAAFASVTWWWGVDLASDPNYDHGLPLLGVLLVLGVWRQRRGAAPRAGEGEWRLWAGAAVLLLLTGVVAANDFPQRWAAVAAALAVLAALAPPRVRGAWRGPLLASLLLVPWPYVLYFAATARLQRLSSHGAEVLLALSGVPVVREGNLLRFEGYQLEVVEACSGLRSLLAMTALAAVVAVAARTSPRRTALLLVLAVPLALGANLLRLVLTGYVSQLRGPEAAAGFFHLAEGLVTFGLGSLVLGAVALARSEEGS